MGDRKRVLVGLAVFLALATSPLWLNLARGSSGAPPRLSLPERGKRCIFDRDVMRRDHAALLLSWRDQAVRGGADSYTAPDGRTMRISLAKTCLDCHDRPAEFCDRCHAYAGVSLKCFRCHDQRGGAK